jgi:hypothetical protein
MVPPGRVDFTEAGDVFHTCRTARSQVQEVISGRVQDGGGAQRRLDAEEAAAAVLEQPNQIHVSEAVAQALEGSVHVEPRGITELKGKGPVATYVLVGPRTQP